MGQANQQRLLRLTEQDNIAQLQIVNDLLNQLIGLRWAPLEPEWQQLRKGQLDRINWWYRIFIAAHLVRTENYVHAGRGVDRRPRGRSTRTVPPWHRTSTAL